MFHAYVLLWPGDILYMYGLMGMFLFPFRNSSPHRLLSLGVGLLMLGAAFGLYENSHAVELHEQAQEARRLINAGEEVPEQLQAGLEAWEAKVDKYDPPAEMLEAEESAMQGGYFSAMAQRFHYTYWMETEFHYRYAYVDILSMMFIGMALFKRGVLQAKLKSSLYLSMLLLGYGFGFWVNWIETQVYMLNNFSVESMFRTARTYDLGRLLMTVGHIGAIMLLCRSGALSWLQRRLAAVGRMALTNYIMHTVITTFVFVGLAQYGTWQRYELYFLVLGIWAFQMVASPLWLKHFHFGPLEWLWRSLTYLRRQPFQKVQRPSHH